jgi:hypothetical protein
LETKVGLVVLGNFSDESLEGQLSNQEFSALLVASNFSESNSSRSESMGFLHASSRDGRLSGSLAGDVLAGGFASGGLSSGLFRSGHGCLVRVRLVVGRVFVFGAESAKKTRERMEGCVFLFRREVECLLQRGKHNWAGKPKAREI